MNTWKEYKLEEIVNVIRDRIDTSILDETNYISTENMLPNKSGITISSNVPQGNAIHFLPGDILISNIRPYFKKIWKADIEGGCSADVICFRAKEMVTSDYLYYLLSQDSFFDYDMAGAKGTKMPRGDKEHILRWIVQLPTIEEQIKLSEILSSIDKKIDNNNRICHNLEKQAQLLYKSWFTDFLPFEKSEFYYNNETRIPVGWRYGTLGELIDDVESGKRPKGGACEKGIPSIGAEKIESVSKYDFSSEKYISEEFFNSLKKGVIRSGDVLIYKDGAYTGKSTIFFDGFPYKKCAINEHVFIIRSKLSAYQCFLYLLVSEYKTKTTLHTLACAKAAQPGLNKEELKSVNVLIPPIEVIMKFESIVSTHFHYIANLLKENHTLSESRDFIQPMLINGQFNIQ